MLWRKNKIRILCLLLITVTLQGCRQQLTNSLTGQTMGTTFSIVLGKGAFDEKLASKIMATLQTVNQQMSTYLADSEISKFNRLPAGKTLEISPEFAKVVKHSLTLARRSKSAYDPTIGPIVNLWGFGPDNTTRRIPSQQELVKQKQKVGDQHIVFSEPQSLKKNLAGLKLDLNSIAKGYGVDQIAAVLKAEGLTEFLVEIGGETYCTGKNQNGEKWRIGIQYPEYGLQHGHKLKGILKVSGAAVATSGDYQQYFRTEETIFSHIIDPRTGHPVTNKVASVTVIAKTCMLADGLATALFVLGPEQGFELLTQYPDTHALFLMRGQSGEIKELTSKDFMANSDYQKYLP